MGKPALSKTVIWLEPDHVKWLNMQVSSRKNEEADKPTGQKVNVSRSTVIRELIDQAAA